MLPPPVPADYPVPAARIARPVMADADKRALVPLDMGLTALEAHLSPEDVAAARAEFAPYLGQPSYPMTVGLALIDWVYPRAFPGLPRAEALRQWGHLSIRQYTATILGRIMFAPLRLMGLDRALRQTPKQFAATTNYGTRWVAEVAPRHWRLDFEDEVLYPDMLLGQIEAAGALTNTSQHRVSYTVLAPGHFSFTIRWGPDAGR